MTNDNTTTIGIPIYPGFDMLDVAGPYEVFSWMGSMWPDHKVDVLVSGNPYTATYDTYTATLAGFANL